MSLNNHNQEVAETREQHREKKEQAKRPKRRGTTRIRLIPIWLRIIIVALLFAASAILGAMFGYGVMGKGDTSDVFQKSTWTHIKDLVEKE